ncbi:hypothetical protein pb186bvf_007449 [Paramecium bursaria]
MIKDQLSHLYRIYKQANKMLRICHNNSNPRLLQMFHGMIGMQKEKEGETQQYKYMKQNMMRILIDSLRLYTRNGGQFNFIAIDHFLKDDNDYYLSEYEQDKIFSDPILCEKLLNYVKTDFNNNISEGEYDPNFFKQCWEDYAYYKQRLIDKQPWQRQDLTIFNQIYRWDSVYTKIISLIFTSNQFSLLNMQDKSKMEQSSLISKYGLKDLKDQIKQNQVKPNQESDIQLLNNVGLHQQQLQEQQQFIQYDQKNYFQQYEQIQLTPELMMKEQRLFEILGQLILMDLKKQKQFGINIPQNLEDFYSKLEQVQKQPNLQIQKDYIVDLYLKDEGRRYLKKYINGKNITYFISGEVMHIDQIRTDMAYFKSQLEKGNTALPKGKLNEKL